MNHDILHYKVHKLNALSNMKKEVKILLAFFVISFCTVTIKAQKQPDFSEVPGIVIAYSPKSSKIFLGSPSICKLPDGSYVVSHDTFGPNSTEHVSAISRIYKSTNKGKTWKQITEINGAFWSKLFVHKDVLYLLGTDKHHGNLVIRKSQDKGYTWTEPIDKSNGLLFEGEYHVAPTWPIYHNGRIWRAIEDASGTDRKVWGPRYSPMMISAPEHADIMNADSWTVSNFIPFDSTWLAGNFGGWVEGNAIVSPRGELVNILRVQEKGVFEEKAAMVHISPDGTTATFNPTIDFLDFPGGSKKFVIKYDPKTKKYWTLTNYVPENILSEVRKLPKIKYATHIRNTLALCSSEDLRNWKVNKIVLQHPDVLKHGFQYADWIIEGKDLIYVSRTAYDDGIGGAHNNHNSNLITFHRVKNFRKYK